VGGSSRRPFENRSTFDQVGDKYGRLLQHNDATSQTQRGQGHADDELGRAKDERGQADKDGQDPETCCGEEQVNGVCDALPKRRRQRPGLGQRPGQLLQLVGKVLVDGRELAAEPGQRQGRRHADPEERRPFVRAVVVGATSAFTLVHPGGEIALRHPGRRRSVLHSLPAELCA